MAGAAGTSPTGQTANRAPTNGPLSYAALDTGGRPPGGSGTGAQDSLRRSWSHPTTRPRSTRPSSPSIRTLTSPLERISRSWAEHSGNLTLERAPVARTSDRNAVWDPRDFRGPRLPAGHTFGAGREEGVDTQQMPYEGVRTGGEVPGTAYSLVAGGCPISQAWAASMEFCEWANLAPSWKCLSASPGQPPAVFAAAWNAAVMLFATSM